MDLTSDTNITLSQGIGKSEEATVDWLARWHKEWLLVLDNTDDLTLNPHLYFPCCSHGHILITSWNHDTSFYAPQSCQVSNMSPEDMRDLLLKVTLHEQNNETEVLAKMIVQVHWLFLSSRFITGGSSAQLTLWSWDLDRHGGKSDTFPKVCVASSLPSPSSSPGSLIPQIKPGGVLSSIWPDRPPLAWKSASVGIRSSLTMCSKPPGRNSKFPDFPQTKVLIDAGRWL